MHVVRPSTAASISGMLGRSLSSRCWRDSSRSEGYRAKLVVNVTDINDKIYEAARAVGEPSGEFAAQMTRAYFEDTGRLGLGRPDAEPLATETIGEILELIAELIDTGHAYESGGDIYFKVRSFHPYGKLSNRRTEDMDQGEEAGSASLKRGPARLRALEGAQGRRGHVVGVSMGSGKTGLAHRVLRDGGSRVRTVLCGSRWRFRSRLPSP